MLIVTEVSFTLVSFTLISLTLVSFTLISLTLITSLVIMTEVWEDWEEVDDGTGDESYWYNLKTGTSQWNRPRFMAAAASPRDDSTSSTHLVDAAVFYVH